MLARAEGPPRACAHCVYSSVPCTWKIRLIGRSMAPRRSKRLLRSKTRETRKLLDWGKRNAVSCDLTGSETEESDNAHSEQLLLSGGSMTPRTNNFIKVWGIYVTNIRVRIERIWLTTSIFFREALFRPAYFYVTSYISCLWDGVVVKQRTKCEWVRCAVRVMVCDNWWDTQCSIGI